MQPGRDEPFVLAVLDEVLERPELLEAWAAQARASERLLLVVLARSGRAADATGVLAAFLQTHAIGLEIGSDVVAVAPRSPSAVERLARRAVAVYSTEPCEGPLAGLPRFTHLQNGELRFYELSLRHAAEDSPHPARPPDFVGVGAQKAGTTWWARLLVEHPGVAFMRRKERHFFDGMSDVALDESRVEAYHRLFRLPPQRLAGEFTPEYMFWPWVPALLRQAAPAAKVIVLLRDPVERYRSGLTHVLRIGQRLTDEWRRHHLERGLYAAQLARLFEHFPREQVLVLQYERCIANPLTEYRTTLLHLGVSEAGFQPSSLRERVWETEGPKVALGKEERAGLAAAYSDDAARLAELVPDLELDRWESFRSVEARS
jgi:hypothetical protein